MGKKRGRSSGGSSRQISPLVSDSEASSDGSATPPPKKAKPEKTKKGPKTSHEICEEKNLKEVELEYTEADYQNLTNYGLFVRMVRPQVSVANPKISSSTMAALMEAKWREFREGNPFTKKRREEEEKKLQERKVEIEKKKERPKSKPKAVVSEDEEEEENGHVEEEEDKSEDDESPQPAGRIKPLTGKKSSGKGKSKKASSDSEDDFEDEEEEEKPKSRRSAPIKIRFPGKAKPKKNVSEDEDNSDSDISGFRRRSSKPLKIKLTPGSSKKNKKKKSWASESEEEISSDKSGPSHRVRKRKEASEEESVSEESDQENLRRAPKRKATKKVKMSSEEDDDSLDEKPKKRNKKVQEDSDVDISDESEMSEDSDIDDDEDDDGRRKKKKRSGKEISKPVIPGERKSERARKTISRIRDISDRDFERMLEKGSDEEDAEKKRAERRKEREKNKRKKEKKKLKEKFKEKEKKGEWQGEGEDPGNESDHYWYCEKCKDGGDLLLCDTCPRSYHQKCLELEEIPEGDWSCPKCKGDEPITSSSEDEDNHEAFCKVCRDGGDVLLCDFCPCVYHQRCLNPPLKEVPEGEWKCPRCVILDKPLKGKVKNILTWRWSHQLKGQDELDHTHSPIKKTIEEKKLEAESENSNDSEPERLPVREVFVRYWNYSYWDCEWIEELALEVWSPLMHKAFKRKWDQEEPPAPDDGSSFGRKRHRPHGDDNSDDPHNLEERFYRNGIKPDWLQVHRIINHDGGKNNRSYLVKWRDLMYEEATWEDPNQIPEGLIDWDKHVQNYWNRRKEKLSDKKKTEKAPKKSHLKKKLEKQPEYIDKTGGKLHDYQLEGFNWLRFSWAQDTNTILADEMGLGKTIQAISFIYGLWKEGYVKGPFMISAPLSTVPNWEREFEFWAPEMYVVTYMGGRDTRMVLREHEFSYKEGAFATLKKPCRLRDGHKPKFDVLLTSYEMPSLDYSTLASIKWDILVVDEAHRLKSNQSLYFRTMSNYKIDYKLLLTGTPLQNNLEELFNLLNFMQKSKFDNMEEFLENFQDINKDEQVSKLHEMLAPHMLRRMKIDVLKDMPSKSEFIVRVELSAMQKKFYKHILTKNYEALNVKGHSNQTSLKNIMMDLRKCCNHPYLFPTAESEAPLTKKGLYEQTALVKACGKLELLDKMLKVLKRDNHRVLIFSQMTRVMDILEDFLENGQYGYERIDGSIMGGVRQAAIDRFNSPDSKSMVFLLSTKAGGLGINLATADTVIIFDMDWNPHNDIQAFSRAHRIGQKNKVMIYRFVCRNTIEERMTQVCKKKMMLTELIIHRGGMSGKSSGEEKTESLTKKEMNEILKFGAENLFKDNEEGKVVYTDEAIEKLLDRSQEGEEVSEDDQTKIGMNEYLRSFKVASYHVKEVEEEEEEEEEEKQQPQPENDEDSMYWERVLGDSYKEHRQQLMLEQEAIALSLGKGKRVRRQVKYFEQEPTVVPPPSRKPERKTMEPEEEPDEVEVDERNFSDYEPESSPSENESDEEEGAGSGEMDPDYTDNRIPKKGLRSNKEPKSKPTSTELPPLLARVNGQIEVLGFTARQRRAFLDAVMRYGMPPEDAYRSQWLVRDLRNKPEKVFRAYVSLFMRHLCEPVADDAEKFSDGVPREGLSRQHVLTRIGMMALIRRKVFEFEKINGTDSLKEFNLPPIVVGAAEKNNSKEGTPDSKTASKEGTPDPSSGKKTSPGPSEKDIEEAEKKKEAESKDEKKNEGVEEKKQEDKAEDSEKKKEEDGEADVKESKSEDKKDEGEKKEEKMETDQDEKEKEKQEDTSEQKDVKEEKEEEKKEVKDIKDEEKGSEEKETEKEGSSDKKDDPMDVEVKQDDKKEEKKEEKMDVDDEKKDKKDEGDDSKKKDESDDKKEDKDKDNDEEKSVSSPKEKDEEGKKSKSEEDKKEHGDEKQKEEEKQETDSEVKKEEKKEQPKMSPAMRQKMLRERFYIADGGFTELQALWQYEESFLEAPKEFEVWHRRHDYWLLAGVVTHGYRHWQDILNDPRFDIMNRAFRTDAEKMRKAAFLNRRFQLLEQALVIEEQLRKAIKLNEANLNLTSRTKDQYGEVDQLALTLRQIAARGNIANISPNMLKLMAQIETLVGDIKAATYVTMPATLARAPQAMVQHQPTPSTMQQQLMEARKPAAPKSKGSPVIVLE